MLAVALLATACLGGDDDSEDDDVSVETEGVEEDVDSSDDVAAVPTDETIADNGYGDITLGQTLDSVTEAYGDDAVVELDSVERDGIVVTLFELTDVPDVWLVFVDDVLTQVEVIGPDVPSIKGGHRVGDSIDSVIGRYQERIDDGETLSLLCSDDAVIARAREAYRLVFRHDDGVVERIAAVDRGRVLEGQPCPAIDGEIIDEIAEEDDDGPSGIESVDDLVPDRLAGETLAVRNPSTELLDERHALMWNFATEYFKVLQIVDIVDSVVSCLYDGSPPAIAVGVYPSGRMVVAIAVQEVVTWENATCVVADIVFDFVCPFCAMAGPAVDGYLVDVDGTTYAVAYGTFRGGAEGLEEMCDELPACADTRFDEVPTAVLEPDGG